MRRILAAVAITALAACGGGETASTEPSAVSNTGGTSSSPATASDPAGAPTSTMPADPSSTAGDQTGVTPTPGATATTRTQ